MLLLMLIFFWLLAPTTLKRLQTMCVFRDYIPLDKSYYRPGDLIIGGNMALGASFDSTVPHFTTLNLLSDRERRVYPSFFQINPREFIQYVGLVQLLLHFQWNWVGLVSSEDESGEHFISTLIPMLKEKEICLAFTESLKLDDIQITMRKFLLNFITWSKTEVFILYGGFTVSTSIVAAVINYEKIKKASFRKVWILTSHWKLGVGFEFSPGERRVYPSFFQINPREFIQYVGLVQLLLHFQWNWVGLVSSEDESGEHFISTLIPMLKEKEICLAFTERLKSDDFEMTVKRFLLNFITWSKTEVFILHGGFTVSTSIVAALGVGFEFSPGERRVYPSFFQINPREFIQYVGLVQLLLHFQWNWVGLVSSEDESGEHFISTLIPMLKEKEICLAFTESLKLDDIQITMRKFLLNFITWSKTEVFILYGGFTVSTSIVAAVINYEKIKKASFRKVWILTSHWKVSVEESQEGLKYIQFFHGVLHLRDHSGDVSEFSHFLLSLDPLNPQGDVFLPLWWELRLRTLCVCKDCIKLKESYHRPGDLIIGGNLPLGTSLKSPAPDFNTVNLLVHSVDLLQKLLGEKEICLAFTERLKSDDFEITVKRFLLNFFTWSKTEVFILHGGFTVSTSIVVAVINYEKIKKASFRKVWILTSHWKLGVGFEFSPGERRVYPSFFQINPREFIQYVGLVQLLLHFQWNWVGLVSSEDENGEHFISTLIPMLKEKEICLAFTERLKSDDFEMTVKRFLLNFITWSKTEVFILHGGFTVSTSIVAAASFRKVWILTSHWKVSVEESQAGLKYIQFFHGVLHLRDHSGVVSEFSHFLLSLDPLNPPRRCLSPS
ncbi:hypothetical protein E2320_022490, partial [Naja naja]